MPLNADQAKTANVPAALIFTAETPPWFEDGGLRRFHARALKTPSENLPEINGHDLRNSIARFERTSSTAAISVPPCR
jgi:hypothetical protein